MQLDEPGRGFSFQRDEAARHAHGSHQRRDRRRAGRPRGRSTSWPTSIFNFGEERFSRRIARALVRERVGSARSRRPAVWRRSCGAPSRAAATRASIRRRARSRRCASGSTASSTGSIGFVETAVAAPAGRRAAGRHHFSLARRSHRQAHASRARARRRGGHPGADQETACAGRRGSPAQPTGAQRQAAGAERIA